MKKKTVTTQKAGDLKKTTISQNSKSLLKKEAAEVSKSFKLKGPVSPKKPTGTQAKEKDTSAKAICFDTGLSSFGGRDYTCDVIGDPSGDNLWHKTLR